MACAKFTDSDIEEISSELSSSASADFSGSGPEASDGMEKNVRKGSCSIHCHTGKDAIKSEKDSFKRRARTLTFRRKKTDKSNKETKKNRNHFWTFRIKKRLPVRLKKSKDHGLPEPQQSNDSGVCICTGYRRTEDHVLGAGVVFSAKSVPMELRPSTSREGTPVNVMGATASGMGAPGSFVRLFQQVPAPSQPTVPPHLMPLDLSKFNSDDYPTEDIDEILIAQRARDIEQGIEISPNHVPYPNITTGTGINRANLSTAIAAAGPLVVPPAAPPAAPPAVPPAAPPAAPPAVPPAVPPVAPPPIVTHDHMWHLSTALQTQCVVTTTTYPDRDTLQESHCVDNYRGLAPTTYIPRTVHTQVDYIHCLVPDLLQITNCSFYWGVMDRYEAEKLLENQQEGTFLLRDSAQEEFLFSVSFRRYGRSLHARIEQWNHKFSFDSHDPGVFASDTVCGLIEHYKDPSCCMFFEPMLTLPLHRTFAFSLQHLCRAVICSHTSYDGINCLPLPKPLRQYLKYYHYKQKVRVRKFECHH